MANEPRMSSRKETGADIILRIHQIPLHFPLPGTVTLQFTASPKVGTKKLNYGSCDLGGSGEWRGDVYFSSVTINMHAWSLKLFLPYQPWKTHDPNGIATTLMQSRFLHHYLVKHLLEEPLNLC